MRLDFQAANNPDICDSGKSAPVFLMYPVGIGVAALTAAAFSKSKEAWIVRAPDCKTPAPFNP